MATSNVRKGIDRSETGRLPALVCLVITCPLLITTGAATPQAADETNVLILHSYHQGYEWTDNINQGIISVLKRHGEDDTNIFVEYMDTKRYGFQDMSPTLLRVYKQKYLNKKIDIVIACDDSN